MDSSKLGEGSEDKEIIKTGLHKKIESANNRDELFGIIVETLATRGYGSKGLMSEIEEDIKGAFSYENKPDSLSMDKSTRSGLEQLRTSDLNDMLNVYGITNLEVSALIERMIKFKEEDDRLLREKEDISMVKRNERALDIKQREAEETRLEEEKREANRLKENLDEGRDPLADDVERESSSSAPRVSEEKPKKPWWKFWG